MVLFDVTSRTPWSIRPLRSPCSTNSRDRKSIHTLWPCSASCSSGVVAMPDLLTQWDVQHSLPCPVGQREKRVQDRLALRPGELPQPVRHACSSRRASRLKAARAWLARTAFEDGRLPGREVIPEAERSGGAGAGSRFNCPSEIRDIVRNPTYGWRIRLPKCPPADF